MEAPHRCLPPGFRTLQRLPHRVGSIRPHGFQHDSPARVLRVEVLHVGIARHHHLGQGDAGSWTSSWPASGAPGKKNGFPFRAVSGRRSLGPTVTSTASRTPTACAGHRPGPSQHPPRLLGQTAGNLSSDALQDRVSPTCRHADQRPACLTRPSAVPGISLPSTTRTIDNRPDAEGLDRPAGGKARSRTPAITAPWGRVIGCRDGPARRRTAIDVARGETRR